jgi:hypothetical protein
MEGLTFREATEAEKPYLAQRLAETEGEQVSLEHCWVAEQDGKLLGLLAARLVWQIEPLFPEVINTATRSRASLGMYIVAENWIRKQPVHWFFAVTRSAAVKRWAKKLGWFRQYSGAATFVKTL